MLGILQAICLQKVESHAYTATPLLQVCLGCGKHEQPSRQHFVVSKARELHE